MQINSHIAETSNSHFSNTQRTKNLFFHLVGPVGRGSLEPNDHRFAAIHEPVHLGLGFGRRGVIVEHHAAIPDLMPFRLSHLQRDRARLDRAKARKLQMEIQETCGVVKVGDENRLRCVLAG